MNYQEYLENASEVLDYDKAVIEAKEEYLIKKAKESLIKKIIMKKLILKNYKRI